MKPRNGKLEIERDGCNVMFVIRCTNEYEAMELYDRAVMESAGGYVSISFTLKRLDIT
jgi:hypothetical protein